MLSVWRTCETCLEETAQPSVAPVHAGLLPVILMAQDLEHQQLGSQTGEILLSAGEILLCAILPLPNSHFSGRPSSHSQFVVRKMTKDMEQVCEGVLTYLKSQDPTALVEEFNTFVILLYYDKTGCGRSVEQLSFHRDQRWSRKGRFMTSQNSQKKGTATCVLTFGDTRTLKMQCYKDNDRRDRRGSIPVDKPFASHSFSQTHGSMFYLDPRDEESKIRLDFDRCAPTYFKHGGVIFGQSGISIGFGLRTVTHTCLVDEVTGRLVAEHGLYSNMTKNDTVLKEYLSNGKRKEKNERFLRILYLVAKKKFFVR